VCVPCECVSVSVRVYVCVCVIVYGVEGVSVFVVFRECVCVGWMSVWDVLCGFSVGGWLW